MELFKNTNFDFLGKKWPFIIVSLALLAASFVSFAVRGLDYGIDFRGGAVMTVQFASTPQMDKIRAAMSQKIDGEVTVQNFTGSTARNQVEIGTELRSEQELARSREAMAAVLRDTFGQPASGKLDLNNAGKDELIRRLRDALQRNSVALSEEQLQALATAVLADRDSNHSGLLTDFNQISDVEGMNAGVLNTIRQECYLSAYHIASTEVVGPKVGGELKRKAVLATLYALAGMLVYVGFRFEWVYGLGAVLAVLHDTVITVGFFSLFGKEISMTVIAALLTLVGYSMNDTIVIFDRVRENLKLTRREGLEALVNRSINQTLGRTVLTSGLTLLSALALLIWGGPVLHGFSFALVCGIVIGTYSTMFIASPIVLAWYDFSSKRKKGGAPAAARPAEAVKKGPTKAVK